MYSGVRRRDPQRLLHRIRLAACASGTTLSRVIITTGNVAFLPVRLGLLLVWLNYGKKGILDKDHCRLLTFSSLRRLLRQSGYDILETKGISAPYPLALGDNAVSRLLLYTNSLMNKALRGMFAYQIAMVARPKPTLEFLLRSAESASEVVPNRVAG